MIERGRDRTHLASGRVVLGVNFVEAHIELGVN
jgi:hypothetical protein